MIVQVKGGDKLTNCAIGVTVSIKHDRCKRELQHNDV